LFKKRCIVISTKGHVALELLKQAKFIDFKKIRKQIEFLSYKKNSPIARGKPGTV
jgi:hypothetical protein